MIFTFYKGRDDSWVGFFRIFCKDYSNNKGITKQRCHYFVSNYKFYRSKLPSHQLSLKPFFTTLTFPLFHILIPRYLSVDYLINSINEGTFSFSPSFLRKIGMSSSIQSEKRRRKILAFHRTIPYWTNAKNLIISISFDEKKCTLIHFVILEIGKIR